MPALPAPASGVLFCGVSFRSRGIENQPREGNKPRATVAVKRIIADDRGATDGNQPNPEGMYGRLRYEASSRCGD